MSTKDIKTQSRTMGNTYKISNLIKELADMQSNGLYYMDIEITDAGYVDPDSGEWVPHLEYKLVCTK